MSYDSGPFMVYIYCGHFSVSALARYNRIPNLHLNMSFEVFTRRRILRVDGVIAK
jgi:hypothetical protein